MTFTLGQALQWTPHYWRWDEAREVTVIRLYPRGQALLSNNVIVDADGIAVIYDGARYVGSVCVPAS